MGSRPKQIELYRRLMMCHGEMTAAVKKRDGSAKALAKEMFQLEKKLLIPSHEGVQSGGLYYGEEDLCAFYMHGQHLPWVLFHAGLDFLADQLAIATASGPRIRRFLDVPVRYGPELTGAICDLLNHALNEMRIEHRRFETEVEDESSGEWVKKYGALDDPDEDFHEASMPVCNADDEGATLLTIAHFDSDDWAGIVAACEGREAAARQALATIQPSEDGLSWAPTT